MAKKDPLLANIAKTFIKTDSSKISNIIDFIEAPWGLGTEIDDGEGGKIKFQLTPIQRLMVKAYYGIPLDKITKNIPIWNMTKTKLLFEGLTEWEAQEWLYDEGRTNQRPEDLKIDGHYGNLVLALGRRSGKCRYENDLINTTIGSITFKELLFRKNNNENIGIFTYDDKTLKQQTTYDFKIWSNGIKDCYELKTRKGTIETSSGNHPYLIWRDDFEEPKFVDLSELKKGDRIAVAKQNKMFGDGGIGLDKAKILGYLIGDGCLLYHQIVFANEIVKIQDEFCEIVENSFNDCTVRRKDDIDFIVTKKSGRFLSNGERKHTLRNWLEEINIYNKNSYEKFIPECIFKGSKEEIATFISRLFACDGCACVQKLQNGRKTKRIEISYSSVSRELINGVKHLLLKFGIHCKIRNKFVKLKGIMYLTYELSIGAMKDCLLFIENIGIFGKENKVNEILNEMKKMKDVGNCLYESMPIGVWNKIFKIKNEKKLTNRQIVGGTVYDNERIRKNYCPNKDKVLQYGINLNDDFVKNMATSDVVWDEVDSVIYVDKLNTVDLEVANTHIIGGDIISHNSLITSCISCYELYKLIKRHNPATYYGLPSGQEIRVTSVAPTTEQACIVYNMLLNFTTNCQFLKNRILNQTQNYFNIQTDIDQENSTASKKRATLMALTGGCSSNSLRGGNSLVVIFDEMAFFLTGDGSRFADGEVYKALTPSVASFKTKKNGEEVADGKIICISSPRAKYGKFYEEYNRSFNSKENYLMYQMYSALVNPDRLTKEYLEEERKKDKKTFICEFGAEFSDKITAWIDSTEEKEFRKCVINNPEFSQEQPPKTENVKDGTFWFVPRTKNKYIMKNNSWLPYNDILKIRGEIGVPYYMGLDLGLTNDGTAIGITHMREDGKIEIDYVDAWYSGSSEIWEIGDSNIYSIYNKYIDKENLSMIDLSNEIKEINKWFPIVKGQFDQHNGMTFKQYLESIGLSQFEMVYSSEQFKHDIFQLFKQLCMEDQIVIPPHNILIEEMLSLEAEMKSKGRIEVKKPKGKKGAKDDISDAVARSVYLCYMDNIGMTGLLPSSTQQQINSMKTSVSSMHTRENFMRRQYEEQIAEQKFRREASRYTGNYGMGAGRRYV